jgi:hypothetical protein
VSPLLLEENEREEVDMEADPYRNFSREDVSDLPKELSWEQYLGSVYE